MGNSIYRYDDIEINVSNRQIKIKDRIICLTSEISGKKPWLFLKVLLEGNGHIVSYDYLNDHAGIWPDDRGAGIDHRGSMKKWASAFNQVYSFIRTKYGEGYYIDCPFEPVNESDIDRKLNYIKHTLEAYYDNNKYKELCKKEYIKRPAFSKSLYAISSNNRVVCIEGNMGTGKSHLVTQLISSLKNDTANKIAYYYCSHNNDNSNFVKKIICFFAFQLADVCEEYKLMLIDYLMSNRNFLTFTDNNNSILNYLMTFDSYSLFNEMIINNIRDIYGFNYYFFIDGLDETIKSNQNELLKFLSDNALEYLPNNIKIVLSYRPENDLIKLHSGLKKTVVSLSVENLDDGIRNYIEKRLSECFDLNDLIIMQNVSDFVKQSQGNYRYAELVCDSIIGNNYPIEKMNDLPKELDGIYASEFLRIINESEMSKKIKLPVTVLILLHFAVSVDFFKDIMIWNDEEYQLFLASMKNFVGEFSDSSSTKKISFSDSLFYEWLAKNKDDKDLELDINKACSRIEQVCWDYYNHFESIQDYYLLKLIYNFINEYGSPKHRKDANQNIHFLIVLQEQSFVYSDYSFCKTVMDAIEVNISESTSLTIDEYHIYLQALLNMFVLEDKVENDSERTRLVNQAAKYADIIKEIYPGTYTSYYLNKIWFDINRQNMKETEIFSAINNDFEYIKKFLNDHEFDEKENWQIFLLYFEGVSLYKHCDYKKSKEKLELCEKKAKLFYSKKDQLLLLVYNQLGWAYFQTGDYDKEKECFKKSLDLRKRLYGEKNAYTAIGYDALARSLSHKQRNNSEPELSDALSYATQAMHINTMLFGENSLNVCRNYETLSEIYRQLKDSENALLFRSKAEKIRKM